MKKASLTAAFVASLSLSLGSTSVCSAADALLEEARIAEEGLLGAADEDARYLANQPFTREIAVSFVVSTSLDAALADAAVPAANMLEALRAFGATVNLEGDVKPGDRFH